MGFLDPQEFSFFLSIQFITIIILGGLASLLGSVLGACFLIILPELLAGLDVWQALVYGRHHGRSPSSSCRSGSAARSAAMRFAGSGSASSPSSRAAWGIDPASRVTLAPPGSSPS